MPKLIASALIAKAPQRYGFVAPTGRSFEYDSIVVTEATGLDVIARLAETDLSEIRDLDPKYLGSPRRRDRQRHRFLPWGGGRRGGALAAAALPPSGSFSGRGTPDRAAHGDRRALRSARSPMFARRNAGQGSRPRAGTMLGHSRGGGASGSVIARPASRPFARPSGGPGEDARVWRGETFESGIAKTVPRIGAGLRPSQCVGQP